MVYCTSGNIGQFATANADDFGECEECGDGTNDGPEEDEVPLFRDGDRLLCGGCHPDNKTAVTKDED